MWRARAKTGDASSRAHARADRRATSPDESRDRLARSRSLMRRLSCPSDSFSSRGRSCGSVIQPGWHEPGALYASPARCATRRVPAPSPTCGAGTPRLATSRSEPGENALQPGLDLRPLALVPAQALGELLVGALDLCQPKGERLALF